ncbi:UNVERIFIED_CONTAM: hypothetical protein GTU68_029104 [Idotea baltica]|nr:hypothetical protein [Idotea baltica]
MGFEEATPIQEQAMPVILEGYDLIACAQTGTGKTAAFLIPLIDILDGIDGKHTKGLILCPTRELAQQIDRECEGLTYHTRVSSVSVYGGNKGGNDFSRQKEAIQQGAGIIIATPGRITKTLKSMGFDVEAMHSDRDQTERERIMNDFKNHAVRILVATDIVSRGIDVSNLSHVVNFNVPPDPEDYVHRIGRTARAETTGVAVTFVNPDDQFRFSKIERLIERELEIQPLPEHVGEGPVYDRSGKKKRFGNKGGGYKKGGGRGGNFRKKSGGGGKRNSGGPNRGGGGGNRNSGGGNSGGGKRNSGGPNRGGGGGNRNARPSGGNKSSS